MPQNKKSLSQQITILTLPLDVFRMILRLLSARNIWAAREVNRRFQQVVTTPATWNLRPQANTLDYLKFRMMQEKLLSLRNTNQLSIDEYTRIAMRISSIQNIQFLEPVQVIRVEDRLSNLRDNIIDRVRREDPVWGTMAKHRTIAALILLCVAVGLFYSLRYKLSDKLDCSLKSNEVAFTKNVKEYLDLSYLQSFVTGSGIGLLVKVKHTRALVRAYLAGYYRDSLPIVDLTSTLNRSINFSFRKAFLSIVHHRELVALVLGIAILSMMLTKDIYNFASDPCITNLATNFNYCFRQCDGARFSIFFNMKKPNHVGFFAAGFFLAYSMIATAIQIFSLSSNLSSFAVNKVKSTFFVNPRVIVGAEDPPAQTLALV